ncbi:hypothetical protein PAXRUDRAFT_571525 [Paxillus rubicundulus Ve08.2h10]|uniref:Secreted protein n=1 Tax=Paxillus rubicundulus Ve08.2h10 TaxID=930991 RepID=A0A0D0E529_9AGAM|nr:hypothetical protein PAXRUDRAFT_571525 [Paxillus rubicundulus Ve08.2h10]
MPLKLFTSVVTVNVNLVASSLFCAREASKMSKSQTASTPRLCTYHLMTAQPIRSALLCQRTKCVLLQAGLSTMVRLRPTVCGTVVLRMCAPGTRYRRGSTKCHRGPIIRYL